MSESVSLRVARQRVQSVLSEVDPIPAGAKGYRVHDFNVSAGQVGHSFVIAIAVRQQRNQSDDIRFYLFDDQQFSFWSLGQIAVSSILAPSIINADLVFKPQSSGRYHVILDNRHSTFTPKSVSITITEEWIAEEIVQPRQVQVGTKVAPKGKLGVLARLVGRFRALPLVSSILGFLAIETVFTSFGILVASYLAPALGLRSGDPWPFVAALAFGGIVVFGIFYFGMTGRPLLLGPPGM